MTVHELRKAGYKVGVFHIREHINEKHLSPRGGSTMVHITTPDNEELHGVANCSKHDNYNKKLGVRIAIGRALVGSNKSLTNV